MSKYYRGLNSTSKASRFYFDPDEFEDELSLGAECMLRSQYDMDIGNRLTNKEIRKIKESTYEEMDSYLEELIQKGYLVEIVNE